MEWMIDTANLDAIKEAVDMLPLAGITTNPSILKAELPFDYETQLKAIRALTPGMTMHVQLGSESCEGMLEEAAYLQNLLGRDIYVKVPTTEVGVKAMKRLKDRGVNVTATAIYYPLQAMLAVSAGADYLAPYCNRMEQNEIDFGKAIEQIRDMIDLGGYDAKILGASFKNAGQVVRAIDSGAHAVTVQPAMLRSVLKSALVTDAVAAFTKDYALVTKK